MANQVFFTAHPELNQIGACAAIKGNVAIFVINEEDRERFSAIPADEEIIIIANGLRDALEADELAAILAHEQGHINAEHLKKAQEAQCVGIVDNMDFELEADAYAVSVCSAKAMLNGLKKTIGFCLKHVFAQNAIPKEDRGQIYRKVAENIKPRFDALRAAM